MKILQKAKKIRQKASEKLSAFKGEEEGLFGIGIIVWIIVFIGSMVLIGTIISEGYEWLLGTIAENVNLADLLVHVPLMSGFESFGHTVPTQGIFAASTVMGDLYLSLRTISLVIITIGFVIIGASYALEQLNVMREGTATNLLSESVLIIVLLFIFPLLFNASALLLNGLNKDVVMHAEDVEKPGGGEIDERGYQEMTKDVARAAGTVPGVEVPVFGEIPGIGWGINQIAKAGSKALIFFITGTISLMSILIAFAVGVFRILATAVLAAAFPLILALRLIPPLRSVSSRLSSSLIGIMLATLVMSLFLRVSWQIIIVGGLTGWMKWAVGVGTLIALGAAFTITAPALSSMAGAFGGTIGRATAFSAGGMLAGAGTAAIGGATGLAAGAGTMGALGLGGIKAMGGKRAAGMVGRAGLHGAAAGGPAKEPFGAMMVGHGAGEGYRPSLKTLEGYGEGSLDEATGLFEQGGIREQFDNYKAQISADSELHQAKYEQGVENLKNFNEKRYGDDQYTDLEGQLRMREKGEEYDSSKHREMIGNTGPTVGEMKNAAILHNERQADRGVSEGERAIEAAFHKDLMDGKLDSEGKLKDLEMG